MRHKITLKHLLLIALFGLIALFQNLKWTPNLDKEIELKIDQQEASWQFHNTEEWRTQKLAPYDKTYSQAEKITHHDTSKSTNTLSPFIIQIKEDKITTLNAGTSNSVNQPSNHYLHTLRYQAEVTEFETTPPFKLTQKIKSDELIYDSNKNQLTSNQMVYLERPNILLSGKQFQADLDAEKFSFQKNVKTLYSPE